MLCASPPAAVDRLKTARDRPRVREGPSLTAVVTLAPWHEGEASEKRAVGSACPGVLALAFAIFAARDMPGSPVTEAISVPLLFGAFASAARIGRDGGTAPALPAQPANRRP